MADSQGNYWSVKGFTLIELLLAVFIFGFVISAVYGVYHATFSVVDNAGENMVIAGKVRVAFERINEDLYSLLQGETGFFSGEHFESSGMDADALSFYSSLHVSFRKGENGSGSALIEYFVEEDEKTGLLNLYRSDRVILPGVEAGKDKRSKYLLCDRLKGVRFLYYDEEGLLHGEWNSEEEQVGGEEEIRKRFPAMVLVVLRFGKSPDIDEATVFKTAVALQEKK
jgi:prepilin-type N-terminal cleavage/methylation domain-containing protein